MPDKKLVPDRKRIEQHLRHLTKRWHELGQDVLLEIVHLNAEDRAAVKDVTRFTPDEIGISLAVDHVEIMNGHKLNSYATVNPLDMHNLPKPGKRASTEHIVASFFHFADGDTAESAANIQNFVGPKPTMAVLTGRTPHARPHVYWELEDPSRNLDAWTVIQRGIAATLATDTAVVDAPRIMRIGGTINWPKPQKQALGYVAEIVDIHIHDPGVRPPVTSEQMHRAFAGAAQRPAQAATAPDNGFAIDTGQQYPPALDRALAEASIKAGDGWHNNMKSLVASYVARGWTDSEIMDRCEAFTLAGYTAEDTRREVWSFIEWTRGREAATGGKYAVSPTSTVDPQAAAMRELSDDEKDALEALPLIPWGERNLAAIPSPEFVYSDFYARGYTSTTAAPPKVGKSLLGLAEAVDAASGRGFLTGVEQPRRRVLYYNAEDDQSVLDARIAGLLGCYGIAQAEIAETLFPMSGVEADGFYLVSGNEGIINEALFVQIEKSIVENSLDILIFDPLQDLSRSPETNEVFRVVGQRLRRLASVHRVALGIVHHTRKMQPGLEATIDDMRGGGALRGTSRFNRLLVPMSEDEGSKAGVDNHRNFMRIGDMESNLAPPSSDINRWFEKISFPIPNGHDVAVIRTWTWPDAFDGVTVDMAKACQDAIRNCQHPPRENAQAKDWAGHVIGGLIGIDSTDKHGKAKIMAIIRQWVAQDVLQKAEDTDPRTGRTVPVLVAGANRIEGV